MAMNSQADATSLSSLSLEPPIRRNNLSESLESLVPRIGIQYAGFRNVTEAGLKHEICEQDQPADDGDTDSSEDEEDKPTEERKGSNEAIFAKRREMAGFLGAAMQDMLMAVDFMSLLQAKSAPRAVETMSPALRQAELPNAALDHEIWQARQDPAAAEQAKLAALGRSMNSLNNAADALLGAAERLSKDVERETQYWKQILSVTERGWSVYRVPNEKTLALQFGVNEAGPLFRSRGYANLASNDDGSIRLEQKVLLQPRAIRVRHKRGQEATSVSVSGRDLAPGDAGERLELEIREARDTLFEEELFYEMALEARGMASLGVKNRDGAIHIPIGSSQSKLEEELLIDLVPRESTDNYLTSESSALTRNTLIALQLLLSNAHKQRLLRRTSPPVPLSDAKRPESGAQILRPIMALLVHDRAFKDLLALLQEAQGSIEQASMNTDVTRSVLASMQQGNLGLVEKLTQPLSTSLALSLTASDHGSAESGRDHEIAVEVRTQLATPSRPDYGTEFVLSLPLDVTMRDLAHSDTPSPPPTPPAGSPSQKPETREFTFDDLEDLRLYVKDTLSKPSGQA